MAGILARRPKTRTRDGIPASHHTPLRPRVMTTPPATPTNSFILTITCDELNLVISSLCSRATDLELLASVDPGRGPELPRLFGCESKDELVSSWRAAAAACRALASRLREQQVRQGTGPSFLNGS